MLNGSNQRRSSISRRRSFSSPSSLNSYRLSGYRGNRINDSPPRRYNYQRDPTLDSDPQLDGDIETVTEPLDMYDGGAGGPSHRSTSTSIAPSNIIKIMPNQGYHNRQTDYPQGPISFPSILCIPCPCVAAPGSENCPPTCVTYHPVDPSGAPMPQVQTNIPIPTSAVMPPAQVSNIYHNSNVTNASQFEHDHHYPPNLPAACCGQLQVQPHHPPMIHRYETQQSCPFDTNSSYSYGSGCHTSSPQSSCGSSGGYSAGTNDYRYFAPRRRRRCRREYYLQVTKGKCRTGEDEDSEEGAATAGVADGAAPAGAAVGARARGAAGTAYDALPGSKPTHFPINFRLQKSLMIEPITHPVAMPSNRLALPSNRPNRPALMNSRPALASSRPALLSSRPAIQVKRPALPSASFTSTNSSNSLSKSSSNGASFKDSDRSLSSMATNTSATSKESRPVSQNSVKKSTSASVTTSNKVSQKKPIPLPTTKLTNSSTKSKNEAHSEKKNGNSDKKSAAVSKTISKKRVFRAQANRKSDKKRVSERERPRFGSIPLIQETAASVLRKRHNEIRMQAIREMLESDLRRLKRR